MKKIKSSLFVLTAGILWGLIGLFVRSLSGTGFDSMEIVAIRSGFAVVELGLILLIYNRKLLKIHIKDLWCFIGTGIISLTFFNICYFTTITMTSLSVAAILLYTAPAFVLIMSFFIFKESLGARKIVAVILSFAGCVLVTGVLSGDQIITPLGILIGIGSGFGYALYTIFGRFAISKGYHSLTITFYTILLSAIGTLPMMKPSKLMIAVSGSPYVILSFAGMSFLCTILAYIFYNIGLSGLEGGQAAVIASIEPVTATVLGMIVFGEIMTPMGVAGMLLVFVSIALVNL